MKNNIYFVNLVCKLKLAQLVLNNLCKELYKHDSRVSKNQSKYFLTYQLNIKLDETDTILIFYDAFNNKILTDKSYI